MESHNSKYRHCSVLHCPNNVNNCPGKLFIHVPTNPERRREWLKLMGKENMSPKSRLFVCEDHFDLPNEMLNYSRYKLMGSVKKIDMKPGCVPSKLLQHTFHVVQEVKIEVVEGERAEKCCEMKSFKSSPPIKRSIGLKRNIGASAELLEHRKKCLEATMFKVRLKIRTYLGLPPDHYFLINQIMQKYNLPEKNILLSLMKMRLNRTFSELADDFGTSLDDARRIFLNSIPQIHQELAQFVQPAIKRNVTNKVTFVLDCLEVKIRKPREALHQALTWSKRKKCNTIKYLVACTPDGLLTFISKGYGGKISDAKMIKKSNFLAHLQLRDCVMAGRCLKSVVRLEGSNGFVSMATKQEAKKVASLRMRVKRQMGRIRQFAMLKPKCGLSAELLSVLNKCVVIAGGLINLEDCLVK